MGERERADRPLPPDVSEGIAQTVCARFAQSVSESDSITDSSAYFYATGRVPPLETVIPKIPKQRMGTAAEVAECVLFLLAPGSEYVTGSTLLVDGGLTAIAPPFGADLAAVAEEEAVIESLSETL